MPRKSLFYSVLILFIASFQAMAQDQDREDIVQLSGVIMGIDSMAGLPNVHVYVPRSGRGTISNQLGYFSIPILRTDTLIISCVGYEHLRYAIPAKETRDYVTVIVRLKPSITLLEGVEITTFPTEESFKSAVLALNAPSKESMKLGIPQDEEMAMILRTNPMDGYSNYRYYTDQYAQQTDDQFRGRTNPFLNPFNWYYFFRDLKKKKNASNK